MFRVSLLMWMLVCLVVRRCSGLLSQWFSGQAVGCRGASGLLCPLVVLWTASSGVIGLGLLVSNPDGECLGHGAPGLVF